MPINNCSNQQIHDQICHKKLNLTVSKTGYNININKTKKAGAMKIIALTEFSRATELLLNLQTKSKIKFDKPK